MNAVLEQALLPLERFVYDKEAGILTAGASDFGVGEPWLGESNRGVPGIAIESSRTGNVQDFYLARTQEDSDGEVSAWYFRPEDKRSSVNFVVVYND